MGKDCEGRSVCYPPAISSMGSPPSWSIDIDDSPIEQQGFSTATLDVIKGSRGLPTSGLGWIHAFRRDKNNVLICAWLSRTCITCYIMLYQIISDRHVMVWIHSSHPRQTNVTLGLEDERAARLVNDRSTSRKWLILVRTSAFYPVYSWANLLAPLETSWNKDEPTH